MKHYRLITAAILSVVGVISIISTPKILSSFNETKSLGQHILELSDDIKKAKDGHDLKDITSLSLDYHSKKYKNWSTALDIISYGSIGIAFILAFISMIKADHRYGHYIVWLVCIIGIAIKLTMMFAGAALLVVIIIAAVAIANG